MGGCQDGGPHMAPEQTRAEEDPHIPLARGHNTITNQPVGLLSSPPAGLGARLPGKPLSLSNSDLSCFKSSRH